MSEDNNLRIREIFSILTQGVEMIQYDCNSLSKASADSDIYRICVDTVRPSMAERAQGKIPPGLYLRDISEVREGADAFHFAKNKTPPKEPDNCLSLFTRDWFLLRFRLLADDILVEQEKRSRKYKFWENSRHLTQLELVGVDTLRSLLEGGIQVVHHQRTGKIVDSVLKFDTRNNYFELQSLEKSMFSLWPVEPERINVFDVSEIRPGSHSLGFVKTGSTEHDSENMSIVGSENVFDLQLINSTARDLFAERMFHFVLSFIIAKKGNNGAISGGAGGGDGNQQEVFDARISL